MHLLGWRLLWRVRSLALIPQTVKTCELFRRFQLPALMTVRNLLPLLLEDESCQIRSFPVLSRRVPAQLPTNARWDPFACVFPFVGLVRKAAQVLYAGVDGICRRSCLLVFKAAALLCRMTRVSLWLARRKQRRSYRQPAVHMNGYGLLRRIRELSDCSCGCSKFGNGVMLKCGPHTPQCACIA